MHARLQLAVVVLLVMSTMSSPLHQKTQKMNLINIQDRHPLLSSSNASIKETRLIKDSMSLPTKRRLQQTEPSSSKSTVMAISLQVNVVSGSERKCTLGEKVRRLRDEQSQTWTIEDAIWKEIGEDLQAIINCTEEGDVLLLNITTKVTPRKRIEIPWKLTLSGMVDKELVDDKIPETETKTRITCHDSQGVFYIRSLGVRIANVIIDGCDLSKQNTNGIIEVAACEADPVKNSVELQRVMFTGNRLNDTSAFYTKGANCYVNMRNVDFKNNSCKGVCFAHLSGSSILTNVSMTGNWLIGEESGVDDTLILITMNSTSEIKAVESRDNHLTALHVHKALVAIENFIASHSSASTIYLNEGQATLSGCTFHNNTALSGAAIQLNKVNVTFDNLECTANKAKNEGGCLSCTHSTVTIRSSTISDNHALLGGGIHCLKAKNLKIDHSNIASNSVSGHGAGIHVEQGITVVKNTKFSRNRALMDGGAFFILEASLSVLSSSFEDNSAGKSGGCVAATGDVSSVSLVESYLRRNNATDAGGALKLKGVQGHLRDCSFQENSAREGGSILLVDAQLNISRTAVSDNTAMNGGGICIMSNSLLNFVHSKLDSNEAFDAGGGLYSTESSVSISENSFVKNNQGSKKGGGIYVDQGSVEIKQSRILQNNADDGGGGFLQNAKVHIEETTVKRCRSTGQGGGLHLENVQNATIVDSRFIENEATSGGGVSDFQSTGVTLRGGRVIRNRAIVNGGGLFCKKECSWHVSGVTIESNSATYGGGFFTRKDGNITFTQTNFTQNMANITGGGVLAYEAKVMQMIGCQFTNNTADGNGGGFMSVNTNATITDCVFERNVANVSGAAVQARLNSSLLLYRVRIASSTAETGAAVGLSNSVLKASHLTVMRNNASDDGGGILAKGCSSMLCSDCIFQNNTSNRGGAVSIAFDATCIASYPFQFIDCVFEYNTARVGGALHFVSQDVHKNCEEVGADCTFVIFTGCAFLGNKATEGGAALLARVPHAFRYSCESFARDYPMEFYSRATLTRMHVIPSRNNSCPLFDNGDEEKHGHFIESYPRSAIASIHGREISRDMPVEHRSGERLQTITVTLLDQYGRPSPPYPTKDPIQATIRSQGLISGNVPIELEDGQGKFNGIRATARPGVYGITIEFSDEAVEPTKFSVKIQECIIGEYSSQNGEQCLNCTANQFNFHPKGKDCFLCPSNADCSTRVILPSKGYANRHPCSQHVQSCLAKSACDFPGREKKMKGSMRHLTACPKPADNSTLIADYTDAQCSEGHAGSLCGSCLPGYAQTQMSECKKCFSPVVSVMLLTVGIIFTVGLNVFAVRTNLPAHRMSEAARSRRSLQSIVTRASAATDVEMVAILEKESIISEASLPSSSQTLPENSQRSAETAKSKVAEIFKVVLNFMQTEAAAASINSNWTESVATLFSFANYVGCVTSDTAGFTSDCLSSDRTLSSRAVTRTLVSLAIPLAVLILFVAFWIRRKVVQSESWAYLRERCLLSLLSVGYLSYVSVTKTTVGVLYCVSVYDGVDFESVEKHKYWAADTSVRCFEGQHVILAASVGIPVLIIFSVGFPLIVVAALVRHGGQERGWFRNATRFLYGAYDEKYIFWESLVMLRKAALATIVVFGYPLGSDIQGTLAVIALTLSLFLHSLCRPFRGEFDSLNQYELWSLATSLLTFASGLLFNDDRLTPGIRAFLTLFVISMVCGLLSFLLFKLFVACADYSRMVLEEEGIEGTERWTHLKALRTHAKVLANERLSSVTQHLYQSVPLAERIPVVRVFSGDSAGRRAEGVE